MESRLSFFHVGVVLNKQDSLGLMFVSEWLQSSIFCGGLQTSQIHYNYNEEKDEDHCSSPGTTTPDKAKLYSRRITLSDHAQPFLQAIVDNTTQDHTVKVHTHLGVAPKVSPFLNKCCELFFIVLIR